MAQPNLNTEGQVQEADQPSKALRPPEYEARGSARTYDPFTYNVSQASYPEGLLTDPQYGGNYVVFYINVHQDSMLLNGPGAAPTVNGSLPPRVNSAIRGLNVSETTLNNVTRTLAGTAVYGAGLGERAAKAVTGTAGNLTEKLGGATLSKGVMQGASTVGSIIDVGLGATAAATAVKTLGGTKKEYKQLKQAIALYLPTDLAVRYGMQWEETDLAGTTAILAMAENFGGAIKDAATFTGGDIVNQLGAGAESAANYVVAQGTRLPGIGEAISKTSGIAANPKKEQLFKQVDFRTFTFTYMFFPKSAQEARNVQEIIKLFKLHMHPEFKQDSFNFMYIYPSEFDIYYYHNGAENLNFHRHTSCVLTDLSVVYSPQGVTSMLPGGMPSQINITLTFKELAILTKENIADGF